MDEKLTDLLEQDERLLWSGRPEAFETLDKTNKKSIVTGTVLKVLITLALVCGYASVAPSGEGTGLGIVLILLAMGAVTVVNPFMIARHLRKQTLYGLTDRRILRAGVNEGSVPYDRIGHAALRIDPDGRTTLLCGPRTVKLKPQKWRGEAEASFLDSSDEAECDRLVLYALPMDEELKKLLEDKLPITR